MKKMISRMMIGFVLVLAAPTLVDIAIPYIALILVLNDYVFSLL